MDASRLFRAVWFTPGLNGRWGLPVIVDGKPGSAKTSRIGQAAKECGLHMVTVIASLREPADFLGLPIPEGMPIAPANSKAALAHDVEEALVPRVRYAPPAWAVEVAEAKRGIVFLDEINTAPPAVQAALLRPPLDGTVGDLVLPPTVRFVAAKNAVEDAGGYDMSMPLANRFGHLSWDTPSVEGWAEYMMSGDDGLPSGMSAEQLEKNVLSRWPEPYAKAKATVIGFLRANRSLMLKSPEASSEAASRAFPSPRTWEMATRVIAGSEIHGLSMAETDELVTAFIGRAASKELAVYSKELDLPDPADILDGKTKFEMDDRLDRTHVVIGSCAALICPTDAAKRIPRTVAMWNLLTEVIKDSSDLAVPACRALIKANLATGNKQVLEAASPTLVALAPMLKNAGYKIGKDGGATTR